MSNHSLLILAFGGVENGAQTAHKSQESCVSGAIACDGRGAGRSNRSHSRQRRFHKASTNRIAQVAGVSVGSLYQYFPSKEALVAAVIERHQQEIMQTVRSELAGVLEQPVEKAARKLVAVAFKAHRVDPKLHRVLAEQIPRVGKLEKLESFNVENYTLFRTYLESHRDELLVEDLELASFVCVTSIEALTHNAVLHYSKMLSDEAMEALTDEGARLVIRYLKG
jgi:AcrR family transcriptional regulator